MAKKPGEKPKPNKRPGEDHERSGPRPELTAVRFELVCEELAKSGSKYKSCEALGFSYWTVRNAIEAMVARGDDSWQRLWEYSYDQYRDSLEVEATRRARDGVVTEWVRNPLTGEMVAKRVEYSDRLMEVLLKGAFPERFRERLSVSGTIGLQPVDVLANLSTNAKREIRSIIMRDLEEQRKARAEEVVEAEYTPAIDALEDMRESGD